MSGDYSNRPCNSYQADDQDMWNEQQGTGGLCPRFARDRVWHSAVYEYIVNSQQEDRPLRIGQ